MAAGGWHPGSGHSVTLKSYSVTEWFHYSKCTAHCQGGQVAGEFGADRGLAPVALAGRLRQRRLDKGWTPTQLARETGIARAYLYRIESGAAPRPSAEILQKLAQALDTTVADLLDQPAGEAPPLIPPALQQLAERDQLDPADVAMLAAIWYRGQQPRTMSGWAHVLSAIRLATIGPVDTDPPPPTP